MLTAIAPRLALAAKRLCPAHPPLALLTWIFLSIGLSTRPADAQSVRTDFPITDGAVSVMKVAGNTLYIGGSFQHVGPYTGSGVPIDMATGSTLRSLRIDGSVHAIASDNAGGWYIGGSFSQVGPSPRSNLAHVRADLTVSEWNPGADAQVRALAVNGGTVYVGGGFGTLGGQPRARLGAVSGMTGQTTAWNPTANDWVDAIVVNGGTVYVGGEFTIMGEQRRNRIAAVDVETGALTAWNPDANDTVRCLTVSNGIVYVGGDFTTIGLRARDRIAALDATSGLATAWNPYSSSSVNALAVSEGTVYAGGAFDRIGSAARPYLAALDAVSGDATSWHPQANGIVHALVVHGTQIYAAGEFTSIGGQEREHVAALHTTTAVAAGWNPRTSDIVRALGLGEGKVFAGGDFTMVGATRRNGLAAIDIASGVVKPWNPNPNGFVFALATKDDVVYVGGRFTSIGGAPRTSLAAVDTATGVATAFVASGMEGNVFSVVESHGLVFAAGDFRWYSTIGTAFRTAGFTHGSSEPDVAWAEDFAGGASVYSLTVNGDRLYYCGEDRHTGAFTLTGGYTSWGPEPILYEDDDLSGWVSRIAVAGDGPVYVAGRFISIGGAARNCLAALDPVDGQATDWNPGLWVDPFVGAFAPVLAIAPLDGTVYVGGRFESIGGQQRLNLAAIDASTGLASAWNPTPNGLVTALESSGNTLFVGGHYTTIADAPRPYLSAFTEEVAELPASPVGSLVHASMPNPFADGADIRFILPAPSRVSLEIFDVAGRIVGVLIDDEPRAAGPHQARFAPVGMPGGVYFYRLTTGSQVVTRKMLFLK